VKVAGKRAYKLARRGETVELAARAVKILSIDVVRYEYPELELLVECGSGTYIRSLGRDLAEALGTSAVMCQLRRTAIGPFRVEEAIELDGLSREQIESQLLSPLVGLEGMARVEVGEADVRRLLNGQALERMESLDSSDAAAVSEQGELVAILKRKESGFAPVKCFQRV
jgi:tRNA pseudouridine55 synthase